MCNVAESAEVLIALTKICCHSHGAQLYSLLEATSSLCLFTCVFGLPQSALMVSFATEFALCSMKARARIERRCVGFRKEAVAAMCDRSEDVGTEALKSSQVAMREKTR